MVKKGRKLDSVKYYAPSSVIETYIKQKLQDLKKEKSSPTLNRRKITVLDKVFQSMADLTYFLEQIAANQKLEEVFRKDLEDLFDMRPEHEVKQLHPYIGVHMEGIRLQETNFSRLMFASILPDDEKFLTYRLRMMHTLQSIVYAKAKFSLDNTFGVYNQATKSALSDMGHALGWTAMLGKYEKDPEYKPKRMLKFPAPYTKMYAKK